MFKKHGKQHTPRTHRDVKRDDKHRQHKLVIFSLGYSGGRETRSKSRNVFLSQSAGLENEFLREFLKKEFSPPVHVVYEDYKTGGKERPSDFEI